MARSCLIFCIGGSEGLFLIASILGPSSLRIGSICIFCCGVSLSCCDNACNFAAGSVVWPGAAGARVRNAKRQKADVRSVKGFFMAALCLAARDSPAETTSSLHRIMARGLKVYIVGGTFVHRWCLSLSSRFPHPKSHAPSAV